MTTFINKAQQAKTKANFRVANITSISYSGAISAALI
jgi:hypothetical protein